MAVRVEIFSGIAGSGKTSCLLEAYRNALSQFGSKREFGKTLWLTPSAASRRQVLQLLTSKKSPVCFSPMVLTFEQLADRILRETHQDRKPVSETERRQVLRMILKRLIKNERMRYFASIAHTSGFLDLVLAFISNLKRTETWPEEFRKLIESRTKTPKDEELAIVYEEYQEFLLKYRLFDNEGRFWYARDALKNETIAFLSKIDFVVVDGFTDFTTTQLEILASIFGTAKTVLISKTGDDDIDGGERSELFEKSELAYTAVEKLFASRTNSEPKETTLDQSYLTPALGKLAKNLFANPRNIIREKNAVGICIIAAGNESSEIKEIANRVKRLLLRGVSPSHIVVCRRSLDLDETTIRRTFYDAGIPFVCSAGQGLSRSPLVKFVANLFALERDDWSFTQLFSTLRSPYFCPEWKALIDEPTLEFLSKLLRSEKIASGRVAILKCVQQRAVYLEENQHANREVAAKTSRVVESLDELLSPLKKPKSFPNWINTVRDFCTNLRVIPNEQTSIEDSVLSQQERLSWESFTALLDSANRSVVYFEDSNTEQIPLSEFLPELNDLIMHDSLALQEKGQGTVRILEAEQVRNLDVPYLFFNGLTESSFPKHVRDDCLYSDADKKKFHELGMSLGHQSSRNQDEMLLFYGIVTRARKELTLSFPEIDRNGQSLYPSPYLSAVRDLFEPESIEEISTTTLDPVPSIEAVTSEEDLRIHSVDAALHGEFGLLQATFSNSAFAHTSRNILSSVGMLSARFHTEGFTKYEGLISKTDHLKRLQKRFPHAYEFSPTRLESYASCGFKFFFEYVLKLAPLASPDIETNYLARGSTIHEILNAMHLEFTDPNAWDDAETNNSIGERFQELVEKKVGYVPDEFALKKALNHIEKEILHELGEAYRHQLKNYHETFGEVWDNHPQPKYLEIPFGDCSRQEETQSQPHAPLSFGTGDSATLVQGRIDRIDVGQSQGKEFFNVIDYKTGNLPRFKLDDVKSGESIQLSVYLLAVKRLSLAGDHPIPFQIAYWGLKGEGFVSGFKKLKGNKRDKALEENVLNSLEEILDDLIPALAERIRNGQFVLNSQNKDCTNYCSFKTVCRIQQLRPVRDLYQKKSPPLVSSTDTEPS